VRRNRKGETGGGETASVPYASVKALAARIRSNCANTDWIMDSGASHHLCQNRHLFVTFQRLSKPVMVHLGDNSTVPAIAAGMVNLSLPSREISIEALFVPMLQTSRMCVSQLSKIYKITFTLSACFLEDCRLGSLTDRIHRFVPTRSQPVMVNPIPLAVQAHSAVLPSIHLWHQRLVHLCHWTLSTLLPLSAYSGAWETGSSSCEVCLKSQHQRKVERKPA